MVMYGIYNAKTLENLVNTLEKIIIKLHGIKSYLWVYLLFPLIGIYQRKEWYLTL